MRRDMRKPHDMKVRKYYQNLLRLNDEELPNLPPFGNAQKLSNDELLDIILFGTPRSWQNEMDRQGFDPMDKRLFEVVDFMENIETTEPMEKVKSKNDKTKGDKSKSAEKAVAKKRTPYYCKHHGPNYTHDTKDCRTLSKGDGNTNNKNKVWSRQAAESNTKSKKELATLIAKTVSKGVKKQLAAADKKRKSKGDDSDEEGECFLVDELTKNLDGFNYDAMEKLKIDDDEISDEVSV